MEDDRTIVPAQGTTQETSAIVIVIVGVAVAAERHAWSAAARASTDT